MAGVDVCEGIMTPRHLPTITELHLTPDSPEDGWWDNISNSFQDNLQPHSASLPTFLQACAAEKTLQEIFWANGPKNIKRATYLFNPILQQWGGVISWSAVISSPHSAWVRTSVGHVLGSTLFQMKYEEWNQNSLLPQAAQVGNMQGVVRALNKFDSKKLKNLSMINGRYSQQI